MGMAWTRSRGSLSWAWALRGALCASAIAGKLAIATANTASVLVIISVGRISCICRISLAGLCGIVFRARLLLLKPSSADPSLAIKNATVAAKSKATAPFELLSLVVSGLPFVLEPIRDQPNSGAKACAVWAQTSNRTKDQPLQANAPKVPPGWERLFKAVLRLNR